MFIWRMERVPGNDLRARATTKTYELGMFIVGKLFYFNPDHSLFSRSR